LQKHRAGTRIYAALKGVNDGGLIIPANEEIYPKSDRLLGKHLKIEKDVLAIMKKLGVASAAATEAAPEAAKTE
jgi:hypothetical protein